MTEEILRVKIVVRLTPESVFLCQEMIANLLITSICCIHFQHPAKWRSHTKKIKVKCRGSISDTMTTAELD
ncbi:hypothetical protein KIN20_026240 [Parelaphostrongylus tenuis]|uniref:Uncharacterized protein n=1 Tax=Parelaphostrongylus tenuis TaxID=148309 RepID=A0AAD5NDN9_PARTN|nr:hypothetical protein KIN20_026240 [Parelaphostrongylus tenuis]